MKRISIARVVLMAIAPCVIVGCATPPPATPSDPTARQRANAEKQEALQEMLQHGQRN